jgi:hypothetical protein
MTDIQLDGAFARVDKINSLNNVKLLVYIIYFSYLCSVQLKEQQTTQ